VNAVDGRGFTTWPVWGFGPDDLGDLAQVLRLRFEAAEVRVGEHVDEAALQLIAERSGGMPRHAVEIAHRAVETARRRGSERIESGDVSAGIQWKGESLARGLHLGYLRELVGVAKQGQLSGTPEAATLFADGRILALPPREGLYPTFAVHPLLLDGLPGK
jgi:hypothetical protein